MSRTSDKTFTTALVALYLAVVLPLAYVLNVWMDEASTLHTTQNGFLYALQNVLADEKQAPLYFLIMSLWRYVSGEIFWARLFAIICGAWTIVFFYNLTKRLFDETQAKVFAALFALHPFFVWASLEIRLYSLLILLSVLMLGFFETGYLNLYQNDEAKRKQARLFFTILAVVSIYTNYYSGFLLVGCFLALIALRHWREAKIYFTQMLIVAVLIAPLVWIIKLQIADRESGFRAATSLTEGVKLIWNHTLTFAFPTELSPESQPTVISIIRIWLVRLGIAATIVALVKKRFRVFDEKLIAFGIISATIMLFLLAAYFALSADHIALRHHTPLFVPLFLFFALFIVRLLTSHRWLVVLAIIFALLIPYAVYKQYPQMAKRGDWRRVARYIERNEQPNQPIVIFQNYDALSLPVYYRGINRILPDKNFFAWTPGNNIGSDDALKEQTAFVISQIPADASEVWLATEDLCQDTETREACRPLENYVEANYTVLETRDFYKERIRLLRKK